MYKGIQQAGKTLGILVLEFVIGYLGTLIGLRDIHIFTFYVFGILITAIITASVFCAVFSVCGMFIFNYFFANPIYSFDAEEFGYPVTFFILLISAFLLGTLAKKNKESAKKLEVTAYRTQVLLETSQMLQKSDTKQAIIEITADRLLRFTNKSILIFMEEAGELNKPQIFLREGREELSFPISQEERDAAYWVLHHGMHAGAWTDVMEYVKGTYLPICTPERAYGVVGFDLEGKDYSLVGARLVIAECALAFEREYYNTIRQAAAVEAKNEKLRSDLLRSISHDIRTPLTGIIGNATLLSEPESQLSDEKKRKLSLIIKEDATGLVDMVENLLSITKLEELGQTIVMQPELLDDILRVAVNDAEKHFQSHQFILSFEQEMQMVQCNPRLVMQVMRNLLENAVKYTKENTKIVVHTREKENEYIVEVADEGEGIPADVKPHIFKMFYTAEENAVDRGRGFGIGLSLCKVIVEAHGGTIEVRDAKPHGSVFSFSLKKARLMIHDEAAVTDCRG